MCHIVSSLDYVVAVGLQSVALPSAYAAVEHEAAEAFGVVIYNHPDNGINHFQTDLKIQYDQYVCWMWGIH